MIGYMMCLVLESFASLGVRFFTLQLLNLCAFFHAARMTMLSVLSMALPSTHQM